MKSTWLFASLLTLALSGRVAAQFPAEWDQIYAKFSEGYRKLDPAMVGNLYTEDAFYLAPGSEIKRGRAEIQKTFESFFKSVAQNGDSVRITFDLVDRSVSGDLGYDIGHYTLTGYSKTKPPATSKGKYVLLWKRARDGVWRIYSDGYSGVNQPPQPPK